MALPPDNWGRDAGVGGALKREIDITLSEVLRQLVDCKPPGPFLPSPHVGISLDAHPATGGESSVRVNKELKAEGNWEVTGSRGACQPPRCETPPGRTVWGNEW